MQSRFHITTITALVACLLLLGATAPRMLHQEATVTSLDPDQLQNLRERWASFSEEEREELRQSLARLKQMTPEKRREVKAHAQRMREMSRRVYKSLSPENRERLNRLTKSKREEILLEMTLAETRDMARRLFAKLPREVQTRLKNSSEEDRLKALLELRQDMDRRISHSIQRMGAELGLAEEELHELEQLPPEKRRARFLKIVKRKVSRAVDRLPLPPKVSLERWREIQALPEDEFYLAILRLRRRFPDFGSPHAKVPAPRIPTDDVRAQLMGALQLELDPAERIKLSELTRSAREQDIQGRQRAAAMRVLERARTLTPKELEELKRTSDRGFFRRLRNILQPARKPQAAPKGG